MKKYRHLIVATLAAMSLVAMSGQALAESTCVWVGGTKVCVPPE